MKFTIRRLVLLAGVPVLAVVALLAVAARTSDAQRSIDLSGSWYVTINGDSALVCTAEVVQSSGELSMNVVCPPILGDGTFTGTVDPKTGAFTTTGVLVFPVSVSGTAATDGQSFSGTWSAETSVTGTFAGTRGAPVSETPSSQPTLGGMEPTPTPSSIGFLDLTGDWLVTLSSANLPPPAGGGNITCIAYLVPEAPDVGGAVSCDGLGISRVTGTVDLQSESFSLDWTVAAISFALQGSRDQGLTSLRGTYSVSVLPGTDAFRMSGLTTNYWGSKVCTYTLPLVTEPRPRPVFGESAAAVDALRVGAGLGVATPPNYECRFALDVNVNGQIDARDAALILQHEAGLIPRLPVL